MVCAKVWTWRTLPIRCGELDNLYAYMMKRLTEANIKTDPKILDEVADLLRTVKDGWDAIAAPGPQF